VRSVSAKILATILPIVALGMLAIFALVEYHAYTTRMNFLAASVKRLAGVQAEAVRASLAAGDMDRVRSVLADLNSDPEFFWAQLTAPDGRVLVREEVPARGWEMTPVTASAPVLGSGRGEVLGRLELAFHRRAALGAMAMRASGDVVALLIILIVLTLSIRAATRRIVGTPLGALNRSIRRMHEEGVREPVAVTADDELGSVIRAYNGLQAAQDEAEQALKRANAELEERVAARTAELARREAGLRELMESSPVPAMLVALDGEVLFGNRRFRELFHVDAEHLSAVHMERAYVDAGERARLLQRLREGGSVQDYEVRMKRPDGSQFWALMTVEPTRVAGEPRLYTSITDISDRKQAEEQMRQAKELAEEATRMKSDFLANMSHEIRTPMNAIIGMAHLALKTELTPRQRDYLSKIQVSGQHLLGVINDILDFSKIEAGRLSVERVPFELDAVLDNVAGLIAEKASAKGLELLFEVERDVPGALVGDPLRLGQVLINYANNAVKFTERGEIAIGVRMQEQTGDEVVLRLSVRDTGIGLTEEQIGRLFQSFQQADTSTTRKYGGTGLGLAICKRLAELMGGEVGVQSAPGEGSTFWFTARLARSHTKPRARVLRPDLHGRRTLVVDDNEHARAVLGDLLDAMQLSVDLADAGAAALERLAAAEAQGRPYELVLLDWQMPQMDGLEVARRIREGSLAHKPHLVMVTAFGREEVLQGAQRAGIESVLIKPVSASVLFDEIAGVLGGVRDERREAAAAAAASDADADLARVQGARVLLVEDNELNQEVAAELLRGAGLVVDIADDGEVALARVKSAPYDLVLMDMQMPVLDGLEATRAIRAMDGYQTLPIVAMTANAMAGDRERCLAAGMNDHVAKPIDPDQLSRALVRWIRPRPGLGADAAAPAASGPALAGSDASAPALEIPGLDVQQGLRRVRGQQALYRSMLRKFADGQRDMPGETTRALQAGDRARAERAAHTLKGVAGNIGASALQDAAGRLEAMVRDATAPEALAAQLDAVAAQLRALIAALDARLAADSSPPARVAVDREQLARLCDRLERLLAEDDAEAAELLDENAALVEAAYPEHARRLRGAVDSFDFEGALALLREARAQPARAD
jgi:PAS domain S-box-containing protein